ncbi:phage tail assembly protein T [Vibrio ziniensis]|uniref:phage tail assembly protein T n=1 Tax=Vibrio ziniensis TaxID=2711221 RepID=UPI001FE881B7|nr:phage tail assembly protein T [Vibrio ziniensis]
MASISGEAVVEWQEYFATHGFSFEMDNWRFAVACASNWNITAMAAGIKLDTPASPSDFFPNPEPTEPVEYDDEQLMAMSASAGGVRFEYPSS